MWSLVSIWKRVSNWSYCLHNIKIFQTIIKLWSAQEFGLEIRCGEITRNKNVKLYYPVIIMSRADNCQTLTKFAHKQSQTRSPSYQCMYQVWFKSLDIYSSYRPENENMGVSQADNRKNFDEICPLANQISTISIHIPSLVKIHWCLLSNHPKTKKQTDRLTSSDWQMDRHTDILSETIIPRHCRVAGYKKTNQEMFFLHATPTTYVFMENWRKLSQNYHQIRPT